MKECSFIEINERNTKILFFILGFFNGLFGGYYIAYHYYHYFAYSTMCFLGYHWHHLYSGGILLILLLILNHSLKNKSLRISLFLMFLIGIAIGLIIDDLTDHFLFVFDPFIFYC